ncbi:hypothetical protein BN14_07690 [Rhizoctonia solani AG-1 IB]|nr:hypothetical protein BN14_07690 [Rhizoctonia solani AG-1 IB]
MSFLSSLPLSAPCGNPLLAWYFGNKGKGYIVIEFPMALESGWYAEQRCTKFRVFQHRKERKGLTHEFIVLKLLDGSVCRIERMGDPKARFEALSPRGSVAQDIAQCFGPEELDQAHLDTSDIIAEVELPCYFDIMDVLKICRAIHEGEKTRNYTLQVYNCYFFAIAIQVCLTRLVAHWEDKELFETWYSHLNQAVQAFVDIDEEHAYPNLLPARPVVFRLYGILEGDSGSALLVNGMKSKLQALVTRYSGDIHNTMSQRINDLLWYSSIHSSFREFIEQMVKSAMLDVFRER